MHLNPRVTDRFWAKVNRLGPEECWEWQAYIDKDTGYRRFGTKYPEVVGAHRFAFYAANGTDPGALFVLHECDNRVCCNPKHLFLGTHAANMKDMVKKLRAPQLGEKSWNSKLSEKDVLKIRSLASKGVPANDIAVDFGIHPQHARAIIRRRFWSHI